MITLSITVNKVVHTLGGFTIPLDMIGGLTFMSMRPSTDNENTNLPHVVLTSDQDRDPHVIDHSHNLANENIWSDALSHPDPPVHDTIRYPEYYECHVV